MGKVNQINRDINSFRNQYMKLFKMAFRECQSILLSRRYRDTPCQFKSSIELQDDPYLEGIRLKKWGRIYFFGKDNYGNTKIGISCKRSMSKKWEFIYKGEYLY